MFATQKEIVDAYYADEDIFPLVRRRTVLLTSCVAIPLLLLFLYLLYIVKSAVGIDLFEFHLHDLIAF